MDTFAARGHDPVGDIRLTLTPAGQWRGETTVRLPGGDVAAVAAEGDGREEAYERTRQRALVRAVGGPAIALTPEMTLLELVDRTLGAMRADQVGRGNKIQTINMYERHVKFLRGGTRDMAIGHLPLTECTAAVIIAWLEHLSRRAPTSARHTKVLLLHCFDLAMRHGVTLWAHNPARRAHLTQPEPHVPVELTEQEISGLWRRILDWEKTGKRTDLSGIIGFQIATGVRSGEVLAVRWRDLDLTATPATATICGTIVRPDGVLTRQPTPKSSAGHRTLSLPGWCADMLRERRRAATAELVFPNANGGILDPHNIGRRFRDARGEEYGHIRQKDFRSTVGTVVANAYGSAAAARQLGHRDPAITHRHYIRPATEAGDHTSVLDEFGPAA